MSNIRPAAAGQRPHSITLPKSGSTIAYLRDPVVHLYRQVERMTLPDDLKVHLLLFMRPHLSTGTSAPERRREEELPARAILSMALGAYVQAARIRQEMLTCSPIHEQSAKLVASYHSSSLAYSKLYRLSGMKRKAPKHHDRKNTGDVFSPPRDRRPSELAAEGGPDGDEP